jgi:hypothetical protein
MQFVNVKYEAVLPLGFRQLINEQNLRKLYTRNLFLLKNHEQQQQQQKKQNELFRVVDRQELKTEQKVHFPNSMHVSNVDFVYVVAVTNDVHVGGQLLLCRNLLPQFLHRSL